MTDDRQLLIDGVIESGGGSVEAIILFGSQLVKASPDRHSAWDFVVIVDDYLTFHEALVGAGHHIRKPQTLTRLAKLLPPSITAFSPVEDGLPVAKCAIITMADFNSALSADSKDHFLKGRMVQKVDVAWVRQPETRDRIEGLLAGARGRVFEWAGPWLSTPMTPGSVASDMLAVSYGGEVRPENSGRVREVVASQSEWLESAYSEVLKDAERRGTIREVSGGYEWQHRPTESDRRRIKRYFRRSKARATMRWGKHILTFNDWLTYIQRKSERRTGLVLEITPMERRWPLLLLWPKVFRVLKARNNPASPQSSEKS